MNKKTKLVCVALFLIGSLSFCLPFYRVYQRHRVFSSFVAVFTTEAELIETLRTNGLHAATPSATAQCLRNIVQVGKTADWSGAAIDQPGSTGAKLFAKAPQPTQYYATQLHRMVERQRASAAAELVSVLHARTGQELGSDPQKWIEEYAR